MKPELSRRAVLLGSTLMSMLGAQSASADVQNGDKRSKTLVVYFTRSGNTRVIAKTLERDLQADLFEIQTATPYPEDYEENVEQARKERDAGFEPLLLETVADLSRYDIVYIGFPIWGETAPPPVRSFLRTHDLRGKTLRPFITHGGYGIGSSLHVLAGHASGATIEEPFVLEADQERRTLEQVRSWLSRRL